MNEVTQDRRHAFVNPQRLPQMPGMLVKRPDPYPRGAYTLREGKYNLKHKYTVWYDRAFPGASVVNNLPVKQENWVRSLGQEESLEEGMATHSSFPVQRIPWTEEAGGLRSIASQRVGHDKSNLACRHAHVRE